jgi:hypothetical protein
MRFTNYLNRLRQSLRCGPQHRRHQPQRSRPQLEPLEDRLVPSTLQADFGLGGKIFAHYTASPGVNNNLTLSELHVPFGHGFLTEVVITDTAEKINVVGTAAASSFQGSGTNTVSTFLPVQSLFVDVLDGNDVVNVKDINYAVTVRHIGAGVDTVNVGDAGSLLGIQGSVGVTEAGAASVTHLNIDDSADKANLTKVLLFGGQIDNLAPFASIAYNALNASSSVTITGGSGNNVYTVDGPLVATTLNTGSGHNQVNVEATDAGAPVTIQGHGGTDTVLISSNPSGLGNVLDIRGTVAVRNITPSTELIVDDSADPSTLKQNVSLSDTALVGLAPAPITYQASGLSTFLSLDVNGRPNFDDTYTVTNTPGVTRLGLGKGTHQVNVQGLTGQLVIADAFAQNTQTTVVVGSKAPGGGGTLAKINGLLNFENGLTTGTSQLIVDDSADTASPTVNLTAAPFGGKITGLAPAATIQYSALSPIGLTINGGLGKNTFNLANPAPSELSLITLDGGNGGDTFNIANTTSNLDITTGSGTNHLNIQGNAPNASMNIHAKAGKNTITIGSAAPAVGGSLANVRGGIFIDDANNATTLTVDDTTDPVFQKVILNKGVSANVINFTTLGPVGVPIDFPDGLQSVDVFGGKGGDQFTILNPLSTPVTLHGGAGTSTLVGSNVPNVWNITGTNAGSVGSVAFTSIQNLVGGTSTDAFKFSDQAGVTGFIDGGAGFNVLDYSAYTTHVSVNLGAHTATGVGGGVFNIEGVIGGSGGNTLISSGPFGAVLVGGTGGNVLIGGSGRDVLIAGPSSSFLQGGTGEAIMIGGTTVWDNNVVALDAILTEWGHTYDPINPLNDYRIRVGHLEHGGGLNGPFLLNPTTVRSNGAHDVLTTGLGLDFVFFDGLDTLTHGPRPGEVFVRV